MAGLGLIVVLLLAIVHGNGLSTVTFDVQVTSSQQCKEGVSSTDLSGALQAVSQLLSDALLPSTLPKSCLEIKNGSPDSAGSPSGYYTIMDSTTGSVSIGFCDMEDLDSCSSLEQAFIGLQSDYQSLSEVVLQIKSEQSVSSTVLQQLQSNYNALSSSADSCSSTLQLLREDLNTFSENTSFGLAAISSNVSVLPTVNVTTSDILSIANSVLSVHLSSCGDVKSLIPNSVSGYYTIQATDGSYQQVYCHFEMMCGGSGPWTRLAYLNMSDSAQQCPPPLYLYQEGVVRACGRQYPLTYNSCTSVTFPSPVLYTEVCGRVNGHQFGTPNGWVSSGLSIDTPYVEGVSLTRGSPRQHIWSFAAEVFDNYNSTHVCTCNAVGGDGMIPLFIGKDYFCESSNPNSNSPIVFYIDDILWDGQDCGSKETECCQVNGVPWFNTMMNTTSSEYLEMRICGSTGTGENVNEDSPVSLYEIYVK